MPGRLKSLPGIRFDSSRMLQYSPKISMKKNNLEISFVEPRRTIEIHLPDGWAVSGPRNTCVGALLKVLEGETPAPIVGAVVNGALRELTYPIGMDARVQPVTMADAD